MSRTYFFTICVIIFQHTGRIVSYYALYIYIYIYIYIIIHNTTADCYNKHAAACLGGAGVSNLCVPCL